MVTRRKCYMVPEVHVKCVPYTTCHMVREEKCEVTTCRRCKMMPEERVCQVPYTTCRMVPQECVKLVPSTVCHLEAYCVRYKVCRQIPICVPVCEPKCPPPSGPTPPPPFDPPAPAPRPSESGPSSEVPKMFNQPPRMPVWFSNQIWTGGRTGR
jgi:hypothetical protein